jgi:hypothetical protein
MSTEEKKTDKRFGDSALLAMAIAKDNSKRAVKNAFMSAARATKRGIVNAAVRTKNAIAGAISATFNAITGGIRSAHKFAMRTAPVLTIGVTAGAAAGSMFFIAMAASTPFVAVATIPLAATFGLGLFAGGSALGFLGQTVVGMHDMDKRSKVLLAEHRKKQAEKAVKKADEAEAAVKPPKGAAPA